jgi:orotate phosphoribosyltransferase
MSHILSLDDLTRVGAHQFGHYQLSSGLHASDYLQCALYLADPQRAEHAGRLIAGSLTEADLQPELIVSPALGGLIIGHETARAIGVPFIFCERFQGEMTLRRGFTVAPGQPLVVVEDVVTTGKSTNEVITVLTESGATVSGVASIVNRSGRSNPFEPIPYQALLSVDLATWTQDECPLCRQGQAITKPGSRPVAGKTT